MYNKSLEYLKSNNPKKVLTQEGINWRKKVFRLFLSLMKLSNPYNYHLIKRGELPKDEPVIFAPTHGYKDDVLESMLTINESGTILFGSIDQFYNTIDGHLANIIGVAIVNRDDPESRKASPRKMERAVELGSNAIIYPEGAWNLTDNELVMKFFNLVYDLARKKNIKVVPVITHIEIKKVGKFGELVRLIYPKYGKHCYAVREDSFDIVKIGLEKEKEIEQELNQKFSTLKTGITKDFSNKQIIESLSSVCKKEESRTLNFKYPYTSTTLVRTLYSIVDSYWRNHNIDDGRMKDITNLVDKWMEAKNIGSCDLTDIKSKLTELPNTKYCDLKTITEILEKAFKKIILEIPYRIGRETAKAELRNILGINKVELMQEYSSYSRMELEIQEFKRIYGIKDEKLLQEYYSKYLKGELKIEGISIKEQWEQEKERLMAEPKYYIKEKEKNYPYRDSLIVSESDVFPKAIYSGTEKIFTMTMKKR